MKTRVQVIHEALVHGLGYGDSPTMQGEAYELAEEISTALRHHERELRALTQHMSKQNTQATVCGYAFNAKVVSNIDNVDCVECLRRLAKDAGRYGNERKVKR